MARRADAKGEVSENSIRIRITEAELSEAKALAEYRELSLSDLIRKLLREDRKRLEAKGEKVPRTPRNQ